MKIENFETKNPFLEGGYVCTLEKKVRPIERIIPSKVEAVEVIKPGGSYNPSSEDHNILLHEAVEEQKKKEERNWMK